MAAYGPRYRTGPSHGYILSSALIVNVENFAISGKLVRMKERTLNRFGLFRVYDGQRFVWQLAPKAERDWFWLLIREGNFRCAFGFHARYENTTQCGRCSDGHAFEPLPVEPLHSKAGRYG
jgi:hypothetical protein